MISFPIPQDPFPEERVDEAVFLGIVEYEAVGYKPVDRPLGRRSIEDGRGGKKIHREYFPSTFGRKSRKDAHLKRRESADEDFVVIPFAGKDDFKPTADVFSRGKIDYEVSAASFMGIFYTSFAFACLVWLRATTGPYRYLLVFIGPWVSDTFAYLTGRAIGRHKLIPEVSPKKTVEGAVGGIVFAALAFVLYGWIIKRFFAPSIDVNPLFMALSGVIVAVVSQIGDLAMSVIKRRYGIKDYGNLFPGHGGVLDRFDSVLLTAPVVVMLSQIPALSAYLV